MRKSVIFLVLVVFVLAYAGCGKKQLTRVEGASSPQDMSAAKQGGQQPSDQGMLKGMTSESTPKEQAPKNQAVSPMASSEGKERTDLKDIHFDFDRYDIHPEDRRILSSHADFLFKNKNVKLVIEGNCDERGTAEYNLALGNRRAKEAMNYLVNLGIDPKKIKTISYGKERPIDTSHNEEAWAKNRRDHFVAN
jgi:peptidoglycan-associated lipoprotein